MCQRQGAAPSHRAPAWMAVPILPNSSARGSMASSHSSNSKKHQKWPGIQASPAKSMQKFERRRVSERCRRSGRGAAFMPLQRSDRTRRPDSVPPPANQPRRSGLKPALRSIRHLANHGRHAKWMPHDSKTHETPDHDESNQIKPLNKNQPPTPTHCVRPLHHHKRTKNAHFPSGTNRNQLPN